MAVTVAVKKAVIERDGSTFSNRYSIEWKRPRRVRKHSSRGLTQQIGTSDWRAEMDSTRLCSVEECGKKHFGRGWCLTHYTRWYRTGSTSVARAHRAQRGRCTVSGCEKTDCGPHGLCPMHKTRMDRHGDTGVKKSPPGQRGAENASWTGDQASYNAVHLRLRVRRGPAKLHACAMCGSGARQWSYDRTDADERQSREGPYSTDLRHYQALCIPCHKAFDLESIRARL